MRKLGQLAKPGKLFNSVLPLMHKLRKFGKKGKVKFKRLGLQAVTESSRFLTHLSTARSKNACFGTRSR